MAKKCVPGVICIENMTLCVMALLIVSVGYLYYLQFQKSPSRSSSSDTIYPVFNNTISTTSGYEDGIYTPPLKTIDIRGPIELPPLPRRGLPEGSIPLHSVPLGVGIPVNIRTSTANTPYRQIGILTKNTKQGSEPLILPLFGRSLLNGRDKWQYYTISGGSIATKLPISVAGRSCTGEYGCDGIYNGDVVYVEGYEDTFRATIYENATMNYIPF